MKQLGKALQNRSSTFLRLLLNHYHKGSQEAVLSPLSSEEAKKISQLADNSDNYQAKLLAPLDALKRTHYSWLLDNFKEIPPESVFYLLALLPATKAEKIKQALNVKEQIPSLSPLMKKFITNRLATNFPFKDTPPFAFIPESALSQLAHFKKEELVQLIDYLGLYDLSEEMRNIVDKKLLEKIYQFLTQKKKFYIKKCLQSKEKLVTNRLNLEYWDGDPQKLSKLLHHRGIVRLSYALCGQDEYLIWHITHILDTGRGKKILRYINENEIPGVTKTLKKQILDVITFFNKVSKN